MNQNRVELRPIRLPCSLEVAGANQLYGETRALSEREASIHSPHLAVPGPRKPKTGDAGTLTLGATGRLSQREVLKIPCRVTHVIGTIVGLQLNVVGLNGRQKDYLAALLAPRV
jgi:hypothetical protein